MLSDASSVLAALDDRGGSSIQVIQIYSFTDHHASLIVIGLCKCRDGGSRGIKKEWDGVLLPHVLSGYVRRGWGGGH